MLLLECYYLKYRSSRDRKVEGSNLGKVKSDTVLPTARFRCDISVKEAVSLTAAMTRRWPRQLVTRFGVIQRE